MTFKPIDDDKARTNTTEFTNLALLLRLLCVLNSKTTSPTVTGPLSKGPQADAATHNTAISTLEAVTTILVQDHEIIATTYSTMSTVLAASESEGGGQPGADAAAGASAAAGTDLDVDAACPSTTEAAEGPFNMKFAAVPNPDMKTNAENSGNDGSSRHANPHNLRVLKDGSDLSGAIKEYEWAYVLM
jgi:hypothetical protein